MKELAGNLIANVCMQRSASRVTVTTTIPQHLLPVRLSCSKWKGKESGVKMGSSLTQCDSSSRRNHSIYRKISEHFFPDPVQRKRAKRAEKQ